MSHNYQYHSDSDTGSDTHSNPETSSDSESTLVTSKPYKIKRKITKNKAKMPQEVAAGSVVQPARLEKHYLDMIPDFYGDSKLLSRFLEICEKLVNKFYNLVDEADFQNEYLMSSILSKIKGDAAVNIASSTISKWADVKQALLNAYSDKRDLYTLSIELTELRQGNETAFEFYNKIQDILNLQISYISNHSLALAKPYLTEYCQNYALRILLRGLKDPLGTLMRTKNPKDMNTALNMLTNDFQLETHSRPQYHKNITHTQHKQKQIIHNTQNRQPQYPQLMYRPNPPTNPIFKPTTNHYPNQFPNHHIRKPYTPNQFPSNQGNKTFNNQSQNVFKPNPNYKAPKPTPMSVSTRQSTTPRPGTSQYRPQQFYNTQNRPNFIAEELFNTEIDEYTEIDNIEEQNPDYYVTDPNPEYYVTEPNSDDTNEFFPITASEQTSN